MFNLDVSLQTLRALFLAAILEETRGHNANCN